MKNRILLGILFVLLFGFSCSTYSQKGDFNNWIEQFEKRIVPHYIDDNVFSSLESVDIEPLDSLSISKYVEKNRIIGNNSMYDFFKYYPLYQVDFGEYLGLLVLKRGGAGAIDDRVILRVFDFDGNLKSELQVANKLGDCSRLNLLTCLFTIDSKIELTRNIKMFNCDTEEVISAETTTLRYTITLNGLIEEIR